MHVRDTTRADIAELATITCAAFYENSIWKYRCPRRADFPLSFRAAALTLSHANYIRPGVQGLVCVSDAAGPFTDAAGKLVPEGTVLGYAWWYRASPPDDPSFEKRDSIGERVERALRGVEAWWVKHVAPNPVYSTENITAFMAKVGALGNTHTPLRGVVPHWYLAALAVGPEFQKLGVGKQLVAWGINRATEECAALGSDEQLNIKLYSSLEGRRLYLGMGFRLVGDEKGPHVMDIPGSTEPDWSMVWDPKGVWTKESETPDERYGKYLVWTVGDRAQTFKC